MTLYCIVGTDLCLSAEAWAAWAQAVASVAAILAAGRIATNQAQKQFDGARRLQEQQRTEEIRAVAETASQISRNALIVIGNAQRNLIDTNALHVMAHGKKFDFAAFQLVISAIEAVPLHELKSKELVFGIMEMRSYSREADRLCKELIKTYQDAPGYADFPPMLDALRDVTDLAYAANARIVAECVRVGANPADIEDDLPDTPPRRAAVASA